MRWENGRFTMNLNVGTYFTGNVLEFKRDRFVVLEINDSLGSNVVPPESGEVPRNKRASLAVYLGLTGEGSSECKRK